MSKRVHIVQPLRDRTCGHGASPLPLLLPSRRREHFARVSQARPSGSQLPLGAISPISYANAPAKSVSCQS
jgi:hypothetical protein